MSEDHLQRRFPFVAWGMGIALSLVVAYPLSLGPLLWLNDHHLLPEPLVGTLEIVYRPLEVWCRANPSGPARSAFDKYLSLWQTP